MVTLSLFYFTESVIELLFIRCISPRKSVLFSATWLVWPTEYWSVSFALGSYYLLPLS